MPLPSSTPTSDHTPHQPTAIVLKIIIMTVPSSVFRLLRSVVINKDNPFTHFPQKSEHNHFQNHTLVIRRLSRRSFLTKRLCQFLVCYNLLAHVRNSWKVSISVPIFSWKANKIHAQYCYKTGYVWQFKVFYNRLMHAREDYRNQCSNFYVKNETKSRLKPHISKFLNAHYVISVYDFQVAYRRLICTYRTRDYIVPPSGRTS